jgi:replicative DNA helicase
MSESEKTSKKYNNSSQKDLPSNSLPPSDIEAEQSLLGSILLNSKILDDFADKLFKDVFYGPKHQEIFAGMMSLWSQNKPADIIFVLDECDNLAKRAKQQTEITKEYLLELITKSSLASSSDALIKIIKDKYLLRTLVKVGDDLKNMANSEAQAPSDVLDLAQKRLFEVSIDSLEKNFVPINEILMNSFDRLSELQANGNEFSGVPTGFVDLDKSLGGLHNSDLIILAARPSMGKAQPLDTNIKTLDGWKKLSELVTGDSLASIDGKQSLVQGIFPQGQRQVFRITFADGRSTLCCKEHLWEVHFRSWETLRVLTTEQLIEKLSKKRYQNRIWIPVQAGQFGKDTEALEIDPYLLGCLIGDGGLTHTTPIISSKDQQILENIKLLLPESLHLVYNGGYDYRISQIENRQKRFSGPTKKILTQKLQTLGLFGKTSNQKFIPKDYLNASFDSRVNILKGLMDTDGWIEKTGSIRFCTVSSQLATDVQELVRSLGGYCEIKTKNTAFTYKTEKKVGQLAYVLNIAGLDTRIAFTLKSKLARCQKNVRIKRLNIKSIEPQNAMETACIKVSHASELYICNDYIVTHNTSLALEMTKRIALTEQVGVALFSLEMSKEQLVDKLLASVSGVDSWKIRTGKFDENADEFSKLGEAIGRLDQAPIWIDDSGSLNILELRSKARRLKSKHNVGVIIIDYLQLMSGGGRNYNGNRVQEVSEISRGLKILAKELNIPVIALSQLSRSVEGREDKRPMLSDLRESGSIEQDADVVMFVHREEMYHKETKRKGIADILIAKHRHGETGSVELAWIGRLATFENLHAAKMTHRVNE